MAESGEKPQVESHGFSDYESLLPAGEDLLDPAEAEKLSTQIRDRLEGLLHSHPLGHEMDEAEMEGASRNGFHVAVNKADYEEALAACNLHEYDQVYAAIADGLIGPEYLIEATVQTPDGPGIRFIRMSMDDETEGKPVAGTVNAETGDEETHQLTYSDGLFAQDILKALDVTGRK